jgi:hypothetical protein
MSTHNQTVNNRKQANWREVMKKQVMVAFLAILSVTTLILHGGANAGQNNFVNAVFTNIDSSMCTSTETFIFAHSGKFDSSPVMLIRVIQSDDCAEKLTMDAAGFVKLTADSIILDEKLKSAAVNTTIRVVDKISKRTIPLDISLNWAGIGTPLNTSDDFYFQSPGTIAKASKRFIAVHCNAEASGGVYQGNVNLTPRNSEDAEIVWFTNAK